MPPAAQGPDADSQSGSKRGRRRWAAKGGGSEGKAAGGGVRRKRRGEREAWEFEDFSPSSLPPVRWLGFRARREREEDRVYCCSRFLASVVRLLDEGEG